MRIHIDIDVEPEEIPLATELIAILRQISAAHSAAATAAAPAAFASAAPQVPQQQVQHVQPPLTSSIGGGLAAMVPTGGRLSPGAVGSTSPRPTSPAPPQQAPGAPVPAQTLAQVFRAMLGRLGRLPMSEEKDDLAMAPQVMLAGQVAFEVARVLEASPRQEETIEEFFGAFCEAAFNPARLQGSLSIIPFVHVLPRLPEPFKTKVRDKLIQKVLKFLTAKRPVDCSRLEFFSYVEAFAALIKVEFVNITGAITTITTLLQKPENRCAAITMLGKTVELCLPLLKEKCERTRLSELRNVLQTHVTEPEFEYDVTYIGNNMGWTEPPVLSLPQTQAQAQPQPQPQPVQAPAAAPVQTSSNAEAALEPSVISSTSPRRSSFSPVSGGAASGMPAPHGKLAVKTRFQGHGSTIFTLAYDSTRDSLLSNSRDGQIIVWDPEGNRRDSFFMGQYACSMDVNPRTRCLFLSGVPLAPTKPPMEPSLFLYKLSEQQPGGKWEQLGVFTKPGRLVSCVEAMVQDQGNHLALGESSKTERANFVCIYDVERSSVFDLNSPVSSYKEHTDVVTTLAHHPTSEGLLFSGSRDTTVKLWDCRQPGRSAATLGNGPGIINRRGPHEQMVTCVDAVGCLVATGGLDHRVAVWDLRNLSATSFQVATEEAVVKVALSPQSTSSAPAIAASTNKAGLSLVLPAQGPGALVQVREVPREVNIYDLKWGERDDAGNPFLYAAGDDLIKLAVAWDH